MTRRPRRTVPASILATLGLAAAVLVAWSCVQLLLGQTPLIPFITLAQTASEITWASPAILTAGIAAAALGLVLLAAALLPGTPRVMPITAPNADQPGPGAASSPAGRSAGDPDQDPGGDADTDHTAFPATRPSGVRRIGITRRGVSATLTAAARAVDGVGSATVSVTPRRVTARVRTDYRNPTGVRDEVTDAVSSRLSDLALARPPQLRLRVTSQKGS